MAFQQCLKKKKKKWNVVFIRFINKQATRQWRMNENKRKFFFSSCKQRSDQMWYFLSLFIPSFFLSFFLSSFFFLPSSFFHSFLSFPLSSISFLLDRHIPLLRSTSNLCIDMRAFVQHHQQQQQNNNNNNNNNNNSSKKGKEEKKRKEKKLSFERFRGLDLSEAS